MRYRWEKIFIVISLCFFSMLTSCCGMSANKKIENEEVSSADVQDQTVFLGGMPIGIYMETDGVLVLDIQEIEAQNGKKYSPAKNIVKKGDYITQINDQPVEKKEQIVSALQNLKNGQVEMTVRRNDKEIPLNLHAAKMADGKYKLGIWIRDNTQGLGTITYIDKNGHFGALGHGIHDNDIDNLMEISNGALYTTHISSIKKGQYGAPGSMEGFIIYNMYNRIGTIKENTECGIFGDIINPEKILNENIAVETTEPDDIELGPAKIRCYIGNVWKDYDAEIIAVDKSNREVNKGIVFQVTDPELIEQTGGIVQGNSGTPILQNGKLIGAVTHVFVNDPTRGYGIFIQNMLEHSKKLL